jgi:asparagine synthase (glutamine-hydrolysing)
MGRIAGLICHKACRDMAHTALVDEMCTLQTHGRSDNRDVVSFGGACLGAICSHIRHLPDGNNQPLQNENGDLWIIFDGAIYNQTELREELSQRQHSFRSATDCEVVLQAFQEWQEKCAEQLIGVFAFAIYDQRTKTLILARDRYGVKPLYYTIQDGHTYFASEMKPVMSKLSCLNPNRDALMEWSLYRMVLSSEEFIQGVYSVPPGHFMRFHEGQVSSHRYYSPVSEVDADVYRQYATQPSRLVVRELSNILDRSTQDCLTVDAPVATLCSGGIDSSLMTALAARKREVIALHVAASDAPGMDEHQQAEAVSKFLGVPFVSRRIDRRTFIHALPRVIYLNECPLTHVQSVAFHVAAELARENGVKVLLVGDAADTVLGGNWSRQWILLHVKKLLADLPLRLRKALEDASASHSAIPVRPFLNVAGVDFFDRYLRRCLRVECEEAYRFVTNAVDRSILATKLAHLVEDVSWYLQRGDRLGMAESVEYRTPFLDHRLIKMAINLPWSYQTRGLTEKWAMRKVASQFLPRRIAYRKKVPWDLPVQDYLAPFACTEFFEGGICLDGLGLPRKFIGTMVETYRHDLHSFFNLVNLEIWGRLFLLRQTVEQVHERITSR